MSTPANITVSNIYCDKVQITSTEIPNKFIATYSFSDNSALHGLLISVVGREYRYNDNNISKDAINSLCEPSIIDGHAPVVVSERKKRRDSTMDIEDSKSVMPVMHKSTLAAVAKKHTVFSSRVNVEFVNANGISCESSCAGDFTVTYESVRVTLLGDLRCNI